MSMPVLQNNQYDSGLTALSLICDVGSGVEPIASHCEYFLLAGLACECRCGLAAHHCSLVSTCSPPTISPCKHQHSNELTFERALHLHNPLLLRILHAERCVNMEVLLHNIEQMVALLIKDLLATRNRHDLALHAQDGCAVCKLDVEIIAGEGHNLFFDHKGLRTASKELRENTDWRGDLSEACHCECVRLDQLGSFC